ncbi:MAG TPA: response regulator [Candidatus Binataceae bacterium]|nr:response regulator [Candidatus Binataceae bacterium]
MPDTPTPRIAIIDDNPATLYSTSRVLRSAGFEVREGMTGEAALGFANEGADLMLLDVNLPDMHGFDISRHLRNDPRTARLPIIHLSATFVTEIDKARGLDAGGDGYLTHPVEPPVLIATVNAFLRARRAEDDLRTSEAKFRAVFDNASGGILLLDEDMTFLDVNPKVCRVLARNREEIIRQPLSAFTDPESHVNLAEISRTLEAKGFWQGIFPLRKDDSGDLVHLDWNISAHSFPGVRMAIVTDITERVRLELQRDELLASERKARSEAERANRLKDEFLGTLSHELRTPLNAILLRTQALRQSVGDPEKVERGLAAIERNTQLQARLISDLLDVSRIMSGKLRLDVEPIDLAATIRSALEILAPALEAKGLKLKTLIDRNAATISGDPGRLHQVIWNLVNNAIKFTPQGGEISVALKRVAGEVEITVSDTGQGIKPELLPHLFERFRQGDVSANRTHGGLGLGLAIVKHLVEMHGGTARAYSAGPGKGATFTVVLPNEIVDRDSEAEARAPTQRHETELARLDGVRILVVDDDVDAAAAMSQILESHGAQLATANDVDTALDELTRFSPDVLVSDIGMPGRDGYDLIREVRARGFTHQALPAIALTALARPEDRRRALLAGYQIHLAKPTDATELSAAIATLIGRTGIDESAQERKLSAD